MTGPVPGIARGDRAVCLADGQRRGKHCDIVSVRGELTVASFDDVGPLWCMTEHLHPIPRRPRPDF